MHLLSATPGPIANLPLPSKILKKQKRVCTQLNKYLHSDHLFDISLSGFPVLCLGHKQSLSEYRFWQGLVLFTLTAACDIADCLIQYHLVVLDCSETYNS